MNINFITSMIVSAEFMVVLFIVVITEKLSASFQSDDFKYIKRAWWVNFIYVFLELINIYNKNIGGNYYSNKLILNEIITFFDVLQFALLYYTLVKTKYEYPFKNIVSRIGKFWFVIALIIFGISLIWNINSINILPYIELHLIINVLFNVVALYLSARFFKSMFTNYKLPFKTIFWGTLIYAFIQIAALPEIPEKEKGLISMIGWIIGLISKSMICWGLLLIFKNEASRSRRLEKILGNIFHELKNTLYGIDAPVKRILYSKKANPINEAEEATM